MKKIHYIILISGLIPATWLLGLTFMAIYFAIQNVEFSFDYFIAISSMILIICGYIGLLMLLKGLYKTNDCKKLTFQLCELIGFMVFMLYVSPINFTDWLLEYDFESMLGKWPLIVSLIFSILLINHLMKNRTLANKELR